MVEELPIVVRLFLFDGALDARDDSCIGGTNASPAPRRFFDGALGARGDACIRHTTASPGSSDDLFVRAPAARMLPLAWRDEPRGIPNSHDLLAFVDV